jgi:hypothetical protein
MTLTGESVPVPHTGPNLIPNQRLLQEVKIDPYDLARFNVTSYQYALNFLSCPSP